MNFSSPIPSASQPNFNEGSGMRSSRDASDLTRQWSKNKAVGKQGNAIARAIQKMQQDLGRLRRAKPGGGSNGGGLVKEYTIALGSIGALGPINSLTGKLVTESGVEVNLPPLLRSSVTSRRISSPTPNDEQNTIVVNYTYGAGLQSRTASATGFVSEIQTIVPNYLVGDKILAVQDTDGRWTDLNVDSRMWCAYPVQPQPL